MRRTLRPPKCLNFQRGRGRNLTTLVAFCLVFAFLVRRLTHRDRVLLESEILDQYMNGAPSGSSARSRRYKYVASSINWGNITQEHPPQLPLARVPNPHLARPLPRVQHTFAAESSDAARLRESRRTVVRNLALRDWTSYRKYAWRQDALMPLSAAGRDQFSGWAATLVDSLDTLWIMGFRDEFDDAVAAVAEIDFGKSTSDTVNIFETNIRYLGGLLAAFDLSGREVLLHKAIELGDLIYAGFNTENRMPVDNINVAMAKKGKGLDNDSQVVSASPGTLTLELTRLSQVTGDHKYYDAITGIVELFYQGRKQTSIPGLFPMYVSMSRMDVTSGFTFTLGGCADSLYEYFPKMYALLRGAEPKFETLTRGFMEAAKKHLFFRPMVPDLDDILISGTVNVGVDGTLTLDPQSEHLTCFVGGTFALAGRLLGSEEDVQVGARLARGCAYAYRAFPTGIMPERFDMMACGAAEPCRWDEDKWVAARDGNVESKPHLPKGFVTAKDPRYILRPEAIESVFYLWRVTGDAEWQDAAWDMFQAVAAGTRGPIASAAVRDVTVDLDELPQEDYMESFWLAETLKYFYLVFSPPDLISLDKYVLNTEAHPFLRA